MKTRSFAHLGLAVALALPTAPLAFALDAERERLGHESQQVAVALDPARLVPDPDARTRALARLGTGGGLLLMPDSTADRVLALDPDTGDIIDENFIPSDPDNLGTPINAILSADGTRILISDQIGDVVHAYNVDDGSYAGVFAPTGGADTSILDNIRGIALRPNGNLLVTVANGANAGTIAQFDTDGEYIGNFIELGVGTLADPFEIFEVEIEANDLVPGDWLVSDIEWEHVLHYDEDGAPLSSLITEVLNFPQQIAQAANGNLLVAGFSAPAGLHEFEPDGTHVGTYNGGLNGFRGVYELPNGNLLGTNGGGLHEIDRSNTLVRTIFPGAGARYIERVELDGGPKPPDPEVDLAVSLFGVPSTAQPGDTVTFLALVANFGSDGASEVELTVELPPELAFSDARATSQDKTLPARGTEWVCTDDGGTVTCSLTDDLAGGAISAHLQVQAVVADDAAAGVVETIATVVSAGDDIDPDNNSASVETEILGKPLPPDCIFADGFEEGGDGNCDSSGPGPDPDIVVFDDIDFTVPEDIIGGSVQWDTGATCKCDEAPYNFNIWTTAGNASFFWPGGADAGGGGVATGGLYDVLEPGAVIGPLATFITDLSATASSNWRSPSGVDGYLGFRFVNPDTQQVNYGYVRITTTGASGHPATIVGWAYNSAGDPITIP